MSKSNFMFLRRLHGHIHEARVQQKINREIREKYIKQYFGKKRKNKKCVFLVLTPEHTNLGDHAIAMAEIDLLKNNGIDYVEVTGYQLADLSKRGLLGIFNKYPILINGGGNLGTLWFDVEQLMRDIILKNPKSPIVILPNTFYYENTDWGKKELDNSVKIYNSHKNLHLYAREKISFEKMNDLYRDVKLVPDMVLSQNKCIDDVVREGCLICLRTDREKTITVSDQNILYEKLVDIFGERLKYTDTHSSAPVLPCYREEALAEKYKEFSNAELVVTDRLHGMIFCAITGTPCIVLNSKSPKVLGCYDWIKELEYIKFCDDVTKIDEVYNTIPKINHQYDNTNLKMYYQKLGEELLFYLNNG